MIGLRETGDALPVTDAEIDQTFNKGSDARLAGRSFSCNPYTTAEEPTLHRYWLEGWKHVHQCWAKDNLWRPVKRLPAADSPTIGRPKKTAKK